MRVLPGQASRLPAGPKPVTREQAPADQRRRIVEAATELIARRGYHGTTIEWIVRRAKVGYGTFYKNFSDKEACLIATLREAFEGAGGPWAERVGASLKALFELIVANPAPARVCVVESLIAGPVVAERFQQTIYDFIPMLERGRDERESDRLLPDSTEGSLDHRRRSRSPRPPPARLHRVPPHPLYRGRGGPPDFPFRRENIQAKSDPDDSSFRASARLATGSQTAT